MDNKGLKVRAYFCTWNNYTGQDYDDVKQYIIDNADYGVLGKEMAPTTGTPHIHFYIYFSNKKSWNAIKKDLPNCSDIQRAKGTAEDSYNYITKVDKDYFEIGDMPKQGKRSDIKKVLSSVQSGENMRQIIPNSTSLQSIKTAEICMKYFEKTRNWKTNVYWFYGDTGTGKTKKAYDMFPDAYEKCSNSKWWDGYDSHENVIIDDFRRGHIDFVELLKLLDRYPCKVEIKGGFRQLLAKNIIITAPEHPRVMY